MTLVNNLILALFLTLIIEIAVALLLGYRTRLELKTIFWVNVITNPILNYILYLCIIFNLLKINLTLELLFELIVVLIEWRIMVSVFRKKKSGNIFILSLLMNMSSFLLGFLLLK
jgi:hypothetical protein